MPVRRAADPISVQHIWDAIRSASNQRQTADLSRIVKYLQRVDNCTQTQAELYLQQTLDDGLVMYVNFMAYFDDAALTSNLYFHFCPEKAQNQGRSLKYEYSAT